MLNQLAIVLRTHVLRSNHFLSVLGVVSLVHRHRQVVAWRLSVAEVVLKIALALVWNRHWGIAHELA